MNRPEIMIQPGLMTQNKKQHSDNVQKLVSCGHMQIDTSNAALPVVVVEFTVMNQFRRELCLGRAKCGLVGKNLAITGCATAHQRRYLANELAQAMTHMCHDVDHADYYDAICVLLDNNAQQLRALGETTRLLYADRELTNTADHPVTRGEQQLVNERKQRIAKRRDYINRISG